MQRKHIISLCILLCVLAVLVAFRPSADETMPPTGSASAGLILLDGQSGGFYVLAVTDQSPPAPARALPRWLMASFSSGVSWA